MAVNAITSRGPWESGPHREQWPALRPCRLALRSTHTERIEWQLVTDCSTAVMRICPRLVGFSRARIFLLTLHQDTRTLLTVAEVNDTGRESGQPAIM
jgi:hypothetical protein